MNRKIAWIFFFMWIGLFSWATPPAKASLPGFVKKINPVILVVWDGLRPDSVTPDVTPNLYRFMHEGVQFTDNHSSFPTLTMVNAASFATGDRPGKTGFFGNVIWEPRLKNVLTQTKLDFQQPIFTEDFRTLTALNSKKIFQVNTLFQAAIQQGYITATVGKSGPAYLQDAQRNAFIVEEGAVFPLDFAKELQKKGYPLPIYTTDAYNKGMIVLKNQQNPLKPADTKFMFDNKTANPQAALFSPFNRLNEYWMHIYLQELLPKKKPQLSVVWLRNPDSTEHLYGPGTTSVKDGLRNNDKLFGELLTHLGKLNMATTTNVIVVSDHSHSTVSGPLNLFPLRNIKNGQVGKITANGFSVSGEIRTAELLTQNGFNAYDGGGCRYSPILTGIDANTKHMTNIRKDTYGKICGKSGTKFTSKAYKVPKKLPNDAIIVAASGGTVYFYIPSHNPLLVKKLIHFLASHQVYGSLFLDERYGAMPGTLSLKFINLQNNQEKNPDIIAGLTYDEKAMVQGLPGIEFSDSSNYRGMHGTFSPIDVHNFLAARGPNFRTSFVDTLPTGNVDLVPTIAELLHLNIPNTEGRVLKEALREKNLTPYAVVEIKIQDQHALEGLTILDVINQKTLLTKFSTIVHAKVLSDGIKKYFYFDKAEGLRS